MARVRSVNKSRASLSHVAARRVSVPCDHPAQVRRTGFGRINGEDLAHASCSRCDHDWWEIDAQPVPFRLVADLLAVHYEQRSRRR